MHNLFQSMLDFFVYFVLGYGVSNLWDLGLPCLVSWCGVPNSNVLGV
jgi:hypothetical protein